MGLLVTNLGESTDGCHYVLIISNLLIYTYTYIDVKKINDKHRSNKFFYNIYDICVYITNT